MIFDAEAGLVIDNLGWVDKGAIWAYDVHANSERRIEIVDAPYLHLQAGSGGLFRVAHQNGSNLELSVRRVAEPTHALASVILNGTRPTFSGDFSLWAKFDPAAVLGSQRLILIDGENQQITDLNLGWFNNDNYDLGYQGLTDCITLHERKLVVVSVQRSSRLILIDIRKNRADGYIDLADRGGNPNLRRLPDGGFLASDYDTLCLVDGKDLSLRYSAQLQTPAPNNYRRFIGQYDQNEDTCVVARPFSGDVILLSLDGLKVLAKERVEAQPLAVCMLPQNGFLVRDWKTGKVARGSFRSLNQSRGWFGSIRK